MGVKRQSNLLTGGTGDVNPQTMTITSTGANTTGALQNSFLQGAMVPVPVPKYPGSNNRAIVMEVLSVQWEIADLTPPGTPGNAVEVMHWLSTTGFASGGDWTTLQMLQDPNCISRIRRKVGTTNAGTGDGLVIWDFNLSEYDDLTDQAGHGLLVATDYIWIGSYVNPEPAAANVYASPAVATVTYRMKEIGLTEYIGIVQSQQKTNPAPV